jgi:cytochrome P450
MALGSNITLEELEADPYPIYKRLRDEEPVSWVPAVGLWLVTRYDDVTHMTLTPDVFSPDTEPSTLNRTIGKSLMRTEGSYHRAIRSLIEKPFRAGEIRRKAQGIIEEIVDEVIMDFADAGEVELVQQFAEPVSVRTLSRVLGLDDVPEDFLRHWFDAFALGGANFEGDATKQQIADAASLEADEIIGGVLDHLGRNPNGSPISVMANGEVDGRSLTRAEILSNIKLMILGGMQEPRDLIGVALIGLLTHPEQWESIRADPALIPQAVEEALRCYSPVGTLTRQTTDDTELTGVSLPRRAMAAAVVSSANRDERRWANPDRFDLFRKEKGHLAFGIGSHFCIGAALARTEARVALRRLMELPSLRLDPEKPPFLRGWEFRGAIHLHFLWG